MRVCSAVMTVDLVEEEEGSFEGGREGEGGSEGVR